VRARAGAAALAVVLAAAGCGGSGSSSDAGTTATTASTAPPADSGTTATTTGCRSVTPQQPHKPSYSKPGKVLRKGQRARIVLTTNCGAITIVLDQKRGGPIPNSIAFLVTKHFYDGLTFHRVVPDFVLQGGDPNGDGSGGPGYSVHGPVPAGYRYKLGDVAMAKTQVDPPGTAGSQFFVISGAQGAALPTDYGLLGHAADAASKRTITRIGALAVADGPPSQPVVIERAVLHKG
jgi:cyclophilin family peptidyl-prolyl cis-trans isomerase